MGIQHQRYLRFRIVFVWTGENDLKTLRVDANIFENGERKMRFQTKTDTCGRGLKVSVKLPMLRRKFARLSLKEHLV